MGIQTHVVGFQTQGTKPLGHQNCKWPRVLSILAGFTGKAVEYLRSYQQLVAYTNTVYIQYERCLSDIVTIVTSQQLLLPESVCIIFALDLFSLLPKQLMMVPIEGEGRHHQDHSYF